MLKPISEQDLANQVRDILARVRNRPRRLASGERHVTQPRVACARQANFASRYSPIEADVVVEVPRRGRVLVVEVTAIPEPSIRKATGHRDSRTPFWTTDFEYFMLVLQREVYVWSQDAPQGSQPEFSAPIGKVWSRYFGELAETPEKLGVEARRLAISSWLHELVIGLRQPDPQSEPDQMLLSSGLYDLMQNGDVLTDVIA